MTDINVCFRHPICYLSYHFMPLVEGRFFLEEGRGVRSEKGMVCNNWPARALHVLSISICLPPLSQGQDVHLKALVQYMGYFGIWALL